MQTSTVGNNSRPGAQEDRARWATILQRCLSAYCKTSTSRYMTLGGCSWFWSFNSHLVTTLKVFYIASSAPRAGPCPHTFTWQPSFWQEHVEATVLINWFVNCSLWEVSVWRVFQCLRLWRSEVNIKCLPPLLDSLSWVFHWTWCCLVRLQWLISELQELSCLPAHPPSQCMEGYRCMPPQLLAVCFAM